MRRRATSFLLSLVLVTLAAAGAEAACDAPEHREFDFWIGEWSVHTPDGKLAGTNRISPEYGGCVLHEHYATPKGYSGESFNIYDAGRKVWHQTWVDSTGLLLVLEGRFADGKMVLEGQTVGTDGKTVKHRITWAPKPDGTVRQHWESTDAKGQWGTAFDGTYKRK